MATMRRLKTTSSYSVRRRGVVRGAARPQANPSFQSPLRKASRQCGVHAHGAGRLNVALARRRSVERHFMDTIEGGKWLPDSGVAGATWFRSRVERIREWRTSWAVFFDRNPDAPSTKGVAGQTFDRTVHKAILTGYRDQSNRLAEQVWARADSCDWRSTGPGVCCAAER